MSEQELFTKLRALEERIISLEADAEINVVTLSQLQTENLSLRDSVNELQSKITIKETKITLENAIKTEPAELEINKEDGTYTIKGKLGEGKDEG